MLFKQVIDAWHLQAADTKAENAKLLAEANAGKHKATDTETPSIQPVSREESDDFFDLYDTDGSGAVDMEELLEMVAAFKQIDSSKLNRAKIKQVWDADGDGMVRVLTVSSSGGLNAGQVTQSEFHQRLLRAAETNPALYNQFRAAAARKKEEQLTNKASNQQSCTRRRRSVPAGIAVVSSEGPADPAALLKPPSFDPNEELRAQLAELTREVSTLLSQKAAAEDEVVQQPPLGSTSAVVC